MTINTYEILLNLIIIMIVTFLTFEWTFFIFREQFDITLVFIVIGLRTISFYLSFKNYTLPWSRVISKTFLLKSVVYAIPFLFYSIYFYQIHRLSLLSSELLLFIFDMGEPIKIA